MNILNKVINYLKLVVNPSNGNAEAKLFIALTAFLVYVLPIGVLEFFTKYKPSEFIFYTLVALVLSCLGIDALATNYANKKANANKEEKATGTEEK